NALRRPAATRSLLLLATLALLLQFIGSLGTIRPAKDRFDFSAAICLTASPAAAGAAAPDSGVPAEDHGHAECKLCCSAGLLAFVIDAPGLVATPAAPPVYAAPVAAPRRLPSPWAPQAARAPPHLS
ncbi:MAG TPA: DUF2946 family protein, partial [Rhodocyclaceae bacterium]|nr:DUF2946 family protein [Rhodocyclaceae bacterium]